MIAGAREAGVPVWHVQHVQDGAVFAKGGEYVDFVEGFEPSSGEPVYTKDLYNSFSSPDLAEAVSEAKPEEIIVVGYGTAMCCTCTIIDGIHRGYSFTLVEDAVAAKIANGTSETEMHRSAVNVLQQFAEIKSADEVLQDLKR